MLITFFRKLIIYSFLAAILLFIPPLSADALNELNKDSTQEINCSLSTSGNIPEKTVLERCKYIEEIRKLKIENDRASGIFIWITILTPITGIITLFVTFSWSYINYRKDKRQKEDEYKKDKDRKDDERFNEILTQLGSPSLSIKASAASSLLIFIEPFYKRFWKNILVTVPANLKKSISLEPAIQESLTYVLQNIVKAQLGIDAKFERLNLSRTSAFRLDFEGLDFKNIEVDIAFSKMRYANFKDAVICKLEGKGGLKGIGVCLNNAKMSKCKLHEARLNNSRCKNTQFHESVLTSATFKNSDLRQAQFQRAQLQSAHFESADLRGANFIKANIKDAYFIDAKFDDITKYSILKTYKKSWKKAHFDQDIKTELEQYEKNGNCIKKSGGRQPHGGHLKNT